MAALAALLRTQRRIAVTTHYNPDADAVGGALAWARMLGVGGHAVQVVLPNPAPGNLRWLPGYGAAIDHLTNQVQSEAAIAQAEVLFCLDFNRADRVHGLEQALRQAPVKVLIDHHRGPEDIFQVVFSDIGASSTCQMICDVIAGLGLADRVGKEVATCLYAGIMTDTGSFRFPSTTAHTHRVAAFLLERGAEPHLIHEAIMEDNTLDRLRLTGFALHERLQLLEGGQASVITLSTEDLERFHFVPGDTEGLVNYGLTVRGVRLAAFLAERKDGIKISLRSKGRLPVNELLAAHFQGGGHANAAGGRSTATLPETVERLLQVLPEFLERHPA